MKNKITVQMESGEKTQLDKCKYFLPQESQALTNFKHPLDIFVRGPIQSGPPPITQDRPLKIFVSEPESWQDSEQTMNVFREIWSGILGFLVKITDGHILLIYIASLVSDEEFFTSVVRHLPLQFESKKCFFISELSSEHSSNNQDNKRICLKYSYDSFNEFVAPDGFECYPGETLIMGVIINEERVKKLLTTDVFDKNVLDQVLREEDVKCWWFCNDDLDGITIWHKQYPGEDLLKRIKTEVMTKFGYPLKICTDF